MTENAGTPSIRRKLHLLELSGGRGQSVHLRELGIEEAVVRRERIHEIAVVPHQVAQEHLRFLDHHRRQFGREGRKAASIFGSAEHAVESQPLR